MTSQPSILRRAYDAVALFALLNILGVGALIALLASSGTVDLKKVRTIVAILRGAELVPVATDEPTETTGVVTDEETPGRAVDVVAKSQIDMEILRREAERIKTELDQRLALNNSILLRVTTERERFQREVDQSRQQLESSTQQRREEGFQKQIAIYESLSPKVAVEHLLALPDIDEAAKVLLEIQTRKAKKIVESAKRADQMAKMKLILRRVREVAPDRSVEFEAEGP